MKIFKYIVVTILVILIGIIGYFYHRSSIVSDDVILDTINSEHHLFDLYHDDYLGVKYRYVVSKEFDNSKPTILLIHGAIGSITTFEKYTKGIHSDTANIVILDRPNYGNDYNSDYVHTIDFEAHLVNDLMNVYRSEVNNIILGYSYGGPIGLLAHILEPYDTTLLVSPAIDPDNEFVPGLIAFYKNKYTRFLVPPVWKEASKEKLGHVNDLLQYVDIWNKATNKVIHIHGDTDAIVPYANLDFLKSKINKDVYIPVTLQGVGHNGLWRASETIISILQEEIK